jgi:membrane dipeptidase
MKVKFEYPGIPSPEIIKFHNSCLLIDLHIDALLSWRLFHIDLRRQHPSPSILPRGYLLFHADVPRLRIGNVGAVFLGLVPKPFGRNLTHIDKMINEAEKITQQLPNLCMMARSAEDIEHAKKEHKTAFLLGIEGATCFDGDPRRVRYFAKRGVRYVGLVHFNSNFAASPGIGVGSKGGGLTAHGRIIVEECVRNNIILDLAHISPEGFYDVIDILPEKHPAIVSHAGINRVHRHKRNLDDDQIRAIAGTGGVVGIINQALFIGGNKLQTYVDHIMAARDLAGYKYVAIGSDFDGIIFPMQGFEDVTRFPSLTAALLEAGLPKAEVKSILGENMLRILKNNPPKYPL